MTIYVLDSTMGGAPALSGTNGTMCAVLDWALVTNAGWAIEYTGSNARVYRPANGNRFRLYVAHDSAISGSAALATVRGCENASSVTTLIDPFPTVAQVANTSSCWQASSAVSGTARAWRIYADDGATSGLAWVVMYVNATGGTGVWARQRWGDYAKAYSADGYNTICEVRNSATIGSVFGWGSNANAQTASSGCYSVRSLDGTVKSTAAGYTWPLNGNTTGAPAYGSGYLGKLIQHKVGLMDSGNTASAAMTAKGISLRGYIPNVWFPWVLNSSSVSALDDFTNGGYNPSALFRIYTRGNTLEQVEVFEETATWLMPVG
jgi:hypothetical protein